MAEVKQVSSEKNRIQKILEDANIKIFSVVSSTSGATATRIIEAMVEGEENIDELIKFRHGRIRSSVGDMISALKGNLTAHHKFMLRTIKESIKEKKD